MASDGLLRTLLELQPLDASGGEGVAQSAEEKVACYSAIAQTVSRSSTIINDSGVSHWPGQDGHGGDPGEASGGVRRGGDGGEDDPAKPLRSGLLPGVRAHEPAVSGNEAVPQRAGAGPEGTTCSLQDEEVTLT